MMKITIEPTIDQDVLANPPDQFLHKIVIEHPFDIIEVGYAVELMGTALVAYGYSQENIDEVMGKE